MYGCVCGCVCVCVVCVVVVLCEVCYWCARCGVGRVCPVLHPGHTASVLTIIYISDITQCFIIYVMITLLHIILLLPSTSATLQYYTTHKQNMQTNDVSRKMKNGSDTKQLRLKHSNMFQNKEKVPAGKALVTEKSGVTFVPENQPSLADPIKRRKRGLHEGSMMAVSADNNLYPNTDKCCVRTIMLG